VEFWGSGVSRGGGGVVSREDGLHLSFLILRFIEVSCVLKQPHMMFCRFRRELG